MHGKYTLTSAAQEGFERERERIIFFRTSPPYASPPLILLTLGAATLKMHPLRGVIAGGNWSEIFVDRWSFLLASFAWLMGSSKTFQPSLCPLVAFAFCSATCGGPSTAAQLILFDSKAKMFCPRLRIPFGVFHLFLFRGRGSIQHLLCRMKRVLSWLVFTFKRRMYTDGSSSSWSCLPYPKPSRSLPSYTSAKEAREYVLGTGYVWCKWGCAGDGSGLDTYVSSCRMLPHAGGDGVW